jgi:hypothetical protein
MTMTSKRKRTMRRKKKKATRMKVKMMKTTLLRATSRKTRCSTTLTRSKLLENEAPIPTSRLKDLLNRINITTPPEFKIKRISCPGREEYKVIIEIINRPNVLS